MTTRKLAPVHPGEVLLEEFLLPMGITQYRVAKDVGVLARRINEIVRGTRGVSADTALRLARRVLRHDMRDNPRARCNRCVLRGRRAGRLVACHQTSSRLG